MEEKQVMNPDNEQLLALIDKLLKENPGTNFNRCFPDHFAVFHKYVDVAKEKQIRCFPDRETYQAFSSAKLFFDKFKYVVFQRDDETKNIGMEDHNMPPLEAFHYTEDEIQMKKNRFLEGLNKGDILHLKVIEEHKDFYNLQVLNKYGDNQRIIDCALFAVLFSNNDLVKKIYPPLRVGDLVRAVAFGNIKREVDKDKNMIVSLNPNTVTDNKLKPLHLGRVFKKDIPYYPEDISKFKSFGEYLRANGKFQSPENILQQMRSFGCDPLKTGPLYETKYKKQIPYDYDTLLSEATQKLKIACDKTRKATELLRNGDLLNALIAIQVVLLTYPDNDLALTIRGKIYLALARGLPSRKVEKAFIDFEAALKINCFNEEAAEFRDAILMESQLKFNEKKMTAEAKRIQDHLNLRKRPLSVKTEEFLKNIKKRKETHKKASSPVGTGASSSLPILVVNVKEEPMDV